MIKLKDILLEMLEMAETDPDFNIIMLTYKNGSDKERSIISSALGLGPKSNESKVYKELRDAGKEDIEYIKKQLDLKPLEEACWDGYEKQGMKKKGNRMVPNCVRISEAKKKGKVNPAYLTKDAAAMKKEINRVKKLKSDDPSAYEKWDADYSDKAKTKKYKTKKSAATSAYEKRFGKKEKVNEEKAHEKEMIDGIVDILKQVKDIQNRKKMAIDQLKDFKKEDISVDEKEFLKRCGL